MSYDPQLTTVEKLELARHNHLAELAQFSLEEPHEPHRRERMQVAYQETELAEAEMEAYQEAEEWKVKLSALRDDLQTAKDRLALAKGDVLF